jgi:FkbM family methyltransferase
MFLELGDRARFAVARIRYFKRLSDAAWDRHERTTVWRYAAYDLAERFRVVFMERPAESRILGVDFNGAQHFVALGRNEDFVLSELYVSRVYERVDDFVPKPGWTVLDLGANIGIFSVQQARRGARVYAFEPNPDCFERFRRAVSANGLDELISMDNRAVGRAADCAELVVGNSSLAGSLYSSKIPEGDRTKTFTVHVITVDTFVKELGIEHVDLLKIDVEWSELDVLAGAEDSLHLIDRIVMECHSPEIARQVEEYTCARGFELALHDRTYDETGYSNVFLRRAH